jgi:hypothetical protein
VADKVIKNHGGFIWSAGLGSVESIALLRGNEFDDKSLKESERTWQLSVNPFQGIE